MTVLNLEAVLYTGAIGLVVIGVAGLAIAEAGANLLLVLAGYRWDAVAPILRDGATATAAMVDPVPQALVLTAIVIGVGVQALAVSLLLRVYRAYGTLDIRALRGAMERDIGNAAGVVPSGSQHSPAGERPLPPPEVALAKEAGS